MQNQNDRPQNSIYDRLFAMIALLTVEQLCKQIVETCLKTIRSMKRILNILPITFLLCFCIGYITKQSNHSKAYAMINEGQCLLKDGDLVVRMNDDYTSQYIKNFNRHDKSYSHAGIVLCENGRPLVFHMVSGRENPDAKLKKDELGRFCNPQQNSAYGIFRYDIRPAEIERLKATILKWYTKGVKFDSAFNLETDDRMYCAEMISKALAQATRGRITFETTKLTVTEAKLFSNYSHLPFEYTSRLRIISVDNLYVNPYCHLVKEYNYEKKFHHAL